MQALGLAVPSDGPTGRRAPHATAAKAPVGSAGSAGTIMSISGGTSDQTAEAATRRAGEGGDWPQQRRESAAAAAATHPAENTADTLTEDPRGDHNFIGGALTEIREGSLPGQQQSSVLPSSGTDASRLLMPPPPASSAVADRLKRAAESFHGAPSIIKRIKKGSQEELELQSVAVLDWATIKEAKADGSRRLTFDSSGRCVDTGLRQAVHKVTKVAKQKGRTYTSKYRGVHQTFPTRRWEAQFRRNGKPTSLGCFDKEEEAAKAYDKMMIWCELHQSASVKGGITNFAVSEYEDAMQMLQQIDQDDLVLMLRRDGRAQAAQCTMATKAANLRHSSRHSSDSGTQSDGEHTDSSVKDHPSAPERSPRPSEAT